MSDGAWTSDTTLEIVHDPEIRKAISTGISEMLTEFTTSLKVGAVEGGGLSAQFFAQVLVEIKAELFDLRLQIAALDAAQHRAGDTDLPFGDPEALEAIIQASVAAVQALAQNTTSKLRQKRIADVGQSKLVIPK